MTDPAVEILQTILGGCGSIAVAVSGGVDSLTLATLAHGALGTHATMFHAVSPAVPEEATTRTAALARTQGWTLQIFDAGEFADAEYRRNPANRCFFCKTNLYGAIARHTAQQIVSGTNLDDLGEYRPGLDAARQHGVRHPYVEAAVDKRTVRRIAASLGLGALAELPAAPCLSSRIETGIRIEAPMLDLVHRAERLVAEAIAPSTVRCRVRAGGVVIELDPAALAQLEPPQEQVLRQRLDQMLQQAGLDHPVSFTAYRTGSAFLRPAS